jgi:hypothetical protein
MRQNTQCSVKDDWSAVARTTAAAVSVSANGSGGMPPAAPSETRAAIASAIRAFSLASSVPLGRYWLISCSGCAGGREIGR